MEKTKIGLKVPVFAALACLLALYGGYVAAALMLGYVLLVEEDAWLKKFCVKLMVLLLAFSAASTVIYLIPNLMDLVYSLLGLFGVNIYFDIINRAFGFLGSILSLGKTLLFLFLCGATFLGKTVKLPLVDDLLDKYIF